MKLEDATNIYVGTTQASKAYIGSSQVWPHTNVTPDMWSVDASTFNTLNNTTQVFEDWVRLETRNYNLHVEPNTVEVYVGPIPPHYHMWTSNGYIYFHQDALITFTNNTYRKIVFKTTPNSSYRNLSGFVCSSGSLTYDAVADEYVWEGISSNLSINLNNVHELAIQSIHVKDTRDVASMTQSAFISFNNLSFSQGDSLPNGTYDITSDGAFTLTSQYSTTTHRPELYDDFLAITHGSSSSEYIEITSNVGVMTQIIFNTYLGTNNNSSLPTTITADSGTITKDANNAYVTWTGNASSVQIHVSGSYTWGIALSFLSIEYTEGAS